MSDLFQAQEIVTHEAIELLPEEIQDLLSERALAELQAAAQVSFQPVEDAQRLDTLIQDTEKKLRYLMRLDIREELQKEAQLQVTLQQESGDAKEVILERSEAPSLKEILKLEATISTAIKRYQSVLTDSMRQRRLLSGQMFGSRMSHHAQISRTRRTRQISMTGKDLLNEMAKANEKAMALPSPVEEMEKLAPKSNVVELFPSTPQEIVPCFEPVPDLPTPAQMQIADAAIIQPRAPEPKAVPEKEKAKIQAESQEKKKSFYCSSWED